MSAFHDVSFPLAVALGSSGGPERRTEIVALGSGREERNQRWAMSRRRYDAGTGVKSFDDLHKVVSFFEERRGRLHGFRFHDPLDHKSCAPSETISATDQFLGVGDGTTADFPLIKTYGDLLSPYKRPITLVKDGTLVVDVGGLVRAEGLDFTFANGVISFLAHAVPIAGAAVSAGFAFDVPVRFDTDRLEVNHSLFAAGVIPVIPLVEVVL